jgi:hypothetical protein
MPELSRAARQLTQLLAEELDRTGAAWAVLMSGDAEEGSAAWDWRIDFVVDGEDADWYVSNADTNLADVIPLHRLKP